MSPQPISEIFVSDRINQDTGDRNFSSLWAFSDAYWLSTKNVLTDFNADIATYKDAVWYLGLEYQDLAFNEVPSSSRLFVEVSTGPLDKNELSATGENCRYLWKIVKDRFCPNLRL